MPAPSPVATAIARGGSGDWLRIDTVRGVACILLVSFHALGEIRLSQPRALDALAQLYAFLSIVRMPLFIFLSGYVYALRPLRDGSRAAFLTGKARRLLVPLAFVTAVLVVARELFGRGRDGSIVAIWLAEMVVPSYHLWYLEALVLIFIAIAAGAGTLLRSLTGCAALLAGIAVCAATGLTEIRAFSLGAALSLMPFFIIGVIAARWRDRPISGRVRAGAALVLAATAILWWHGVGSAGAWRYAVSIAALLSVFVLVPSLALVAALGRRSMAIYLYHFIIIVGFAPRLAGGAPLILLQLMLLALLLPVLAELAAGRVAPALLPLLGGACRASRQSPATPTRTRSNGEVAVRQVRAPSQPAQGAADYRRVAQRVPLVRHAAGANRREAVGRRRYRSCSFAAASLSIAPASSSRALSSAVGAAGRCSAHAASARSRAAANCLIA